MTERDPDDDFDKALFDAARQEQPEPRIRARTKLLAQNARAGINAVDSAAPGRKTNTPYLPALGAALVLAALASVLITAQPAPAPEAPLAITPETIERAPRKLMRTEPHDPSAAAAQRVTPTQPERAPATARKPLQPASKAASRPQPSLAEELALLDQARAAFTAKDSARTIALVDQYERELGGTRMRAEAALLRIEALAQSGQRAQAAELARRFVQEHAGNPLTDRARALSKIDAPSEGDQ